MNAIFVVVVTTLYIIANISTLAAYLPQIWQSIKSKAARLETVSTTWFMWTIGALVEFVYAVFLQHQYLWGFMVLIHFVACGIVFILAFVEKSRG